MKIVNGNTRGRPGKWLLDFYDREGKRRRETYDTKGAAKAALAIRLEQLRKGTYHTPAEVPTVKDVAESWLIAKQDRRPSSQYCSENHVSHILPALGDLRLDQVRVADVERFREALRSKLAPRTVNKMLAAVSAIFDHAIKHGFTEKNPARVVDRLKLDTGEVVLGDNGDEPQAKRSNGRVTADEVPTPQEVTRLLEAATEGRHRMFFTTAVHTGAREGELLALTWDDIDLENRSVAIRRTVTWARTAAEKAAGLRGPRFYEPKTRAGRRVIEIPEEIVPELRKWKLACPPSKMGLVFPTVDGRPLHRRTLHAEGLETALTAAKLRHFTVHSLRHFHASVLIQRGTPITEVAARLGHSSPAITMAVYSHFLRGTKGTAANVIGDVLRDARSAEKA